MKRLIKYSFIFLTTVVFSQNTTVAYKVKEVCHDIGINGILDKKYYKDHTLFLKNNKDYSTEGEFNLTVNSKFPLPYSFICGQKDGSFKVSALFTVSRENLNFEIDSIGNFIQPMPLKNENSVLIKDQYKFNANFSKLLNVFFNNEDGDLKLDNLLIKYSKENPNSFMLFWTLVNQFQYKGPRKSYFESFQNLSSKIRNSEYGKMFYQDMINSIKLTEKSKFPNLEFQNKKIRSSLGKKYTLVDFWFSYCKPCLEDIPKYHKLYSMYKDKGLEIISISTDRTEDMEKWYKVVAEKELNWQQYLDENGIKSKFYNINSFPTTFLLDSEGIIIKKNISPEELEKFLEQNDYF
ncbi:hypothetical protein ACM39_08130 [Chryseobacterium sp. FH2]|nr:hypothetical protein ACM39_08130 [Chryseobacterium sp. FH2]